MSANTRSFIHRDTLSDPYPHTEIHQSIHPTPPYFTKYLFSTGKLEYPFDHLSDLIDWANQIEAPDDEEHHRIQITTIHQAKGLEYDHVILPFLNHISPPSKPDIISVDSWITNQRPIPAALIASPIDQTHHQAILSFYKNTKCYKKKAAFVCGINPSQTRPSFLFEPKTHENSLQFWLTPNP